MSQILGILSFLVSVYMIVISIRIILTWFTGMGGGSLANTLAMITDPYLNWFKRFTFLRTGFLDFSPIAALGVLSVLKYILDAVANYERVSIGIILALLLNVCWNALSFILGFLIIVLILSFIARYFIKNIYGPFWSAVEGISGSVIYRISRILFRDRILNSRTAFIVSIAILVILRIVLGFLVYLVSRLLAGLPF